MVLLVLYHYIKGKKIKKKFSSRLASCNALRQKATRVNTRVLQLPVVSRLVMATMTSTSNLCTLVTPDLIAQRSL